MEPASLIALITTAIPFVTAGIKKIAGTRKLPEPVQTGVHALIPVVLGIVSAGLVAHQSGHDWITSLAIGLGSGGAASSVRDIDKNLIGVVSGVFALFGKDKKEPA